MSTETGPSGTVVKAYAELCRVFPGFRRSTRRLMYRLMARHAPSSDWTFMNYGYEPLSGGAAGPVLDAADEPNRTFIQLYHHVTQGIDLRGRDVVEIGSGRGGGAAFIHRYGRPRHMVGLDFSNEAVSFCRTQHCAPGLAFVTGDAENLPFADKSFDVVINVESAHCYGSLDTFFNQVRRVLRPGGTFLFADFVAHELVEELDQRLSRAGLTIMHKTDITPNVVRGLGLSHERRMALIRKSAPAFLVKVGQEFAGVAGSNIYRRFRLGLTIYQSFVLIKTA